MQAVPVEGARRGAVGDRQLPAVGGDDLGRAGGQHGEVAGDVLPRGHVGRRARAAALGIPPWLSSHPHAPRPARAALAAGAPGRAAAGDVASCVLRTALRPRFLGLLGLVLVVGAAFVCLGRWQLGVAESTAHREAVEQARAQAPVALTTVLRPHAPFREDLSSRPVTATGRYAAEGQLLVPDRRLDGRTGLGAHALRRRRQRGRPCPVLRGFVRDPADAGPPPSGTLTVAGGLAPGESPVVHAPAAGADRLGRPLGARQHLAGRPLQRLPVPPVARTPASAPRSRRCRRPWATPASAGATPPTPCSGGSSPRFALWFWFRMVRDEARRDAVEPAGCGTSGDPASGPDRPGIPTGAGAPAEPVAAGDNGRRDDA